MSRCDQCQVVGINGHATHEQGCPNAWLHPLTGEPLDVECKECGCEFTPNVKGQTYCDDDCYRLGSGY